MNRDHKFQWPTMFSGLRGITWADFPREISAGITLAALIIPLNIGYAQVAGLPPVFGLYAVLFHSRYSPYSPARAIWWEARMPPFLRSWEQCLLVLLP